MIDWPHGGEDAIWLGVNTDAFSRFLDAVDARNTPQIQQMFAHGEVFPVDPGTPVLLVDPGLLGSTVRVLKGPYRGRKGVTAAEYIRER